MYAISKTKKTSFPTQALPSEATALRQSREVFTVCWTSFLLFTASVVQTGGSSWSVCFLWSCCDADCSLVVLHHIHFRRDIKFRRHLTCFAFRAIRCWQCHLTCTARWFHTNSHLHSWKLVNLWWVLNGCDSLSKLMMRTETTSSLQRKQIHYVLF